MPRPCRRGQIRDPDTNRCRKPRREEMRQPALTPEERAARRKEKERELREFREKQYTEDKDLVDFFGYGDEFYFVKIFGTGEAVRGQVGRNPITATGISGPYGLVHMRHEEYGIDAYVFAEKHVRFSCPQDYTRIDTYLDSLLRTSDVFIDVFVETPVLKQINYVDFTSGLAYLRHLFHPCIGERSQCPYTNARVHFADLRSTVIDPEANLYRNYFLDILGGIGDIPIRNKAELITYLGDKAGLVITNKQDPDQDIASFIAGGIMKHVPRIRRNFKSSRFGRQLLQFMGQEFYNQLSMNRFSPVSILGPILDMYSLARMFKDFGEGDGSQPRYANNIVFYGGGMHAEIHSKFMKQVGFRTVEAVMNESEDVCINMQAIKQPFFS